MTLMYTKYNIFKLPEKKQECLIYNTNKLNVGFT